MTSDRSIAVETKIHIAARNWSDAVRVLELAQDSDLRSVARLCSFMAAQEEALAAPFEERLKRLEDLDPPVGIDWDRARDILNRHCQQNR